MKYPINGQACYGCEYLVEVIPFFDDEDIYMDCDDHKYECLRYNSIKYSH